MHQAIAPSFFQKKQCHLPGIGTLSMITHPAQTDFVNTRVLAPQQEIKFSAASKDENVFNEFSAISELMKRKLDGDGKVVLQGVGTFIKDEDGQIKFTAIQLDEIYTLAVTAERVIRQDAQHNILVGDRETNSNAMAEYFNDSPVITDRWWVWAIVLGSIAIASLCFYFFTNGFNELANAAGIE